MHAPTARPRRAITITWIGFVLLVAGCTSYRATVVHRQDNDALTACGCPTRGIPVKLQVPSHMEVRIVETFFIGPGELAAIATVEPDLAKSTADIELQLDRDGQTVFPPKQGTKIAVKGKLKEKSPTPVVIRPERPVLSVESKLQYTDKVFTVDFPRPLTGSLMIGGGKEDGITIDSEQYFGSLQASYQERTLGTITELLGGPIAGDTQSAANLKVLDQPSFQRLTRVVAFERFDISQCGWEQRMQDFIDLHLSGLSGLSGELTPPRPSAGVAPAAEAQPEPSTRHALTTAVGNRSQR